MTRRSFHRIWIAGNKPLVKRAPGSNSLVGHTLVNIHTYFRNINHGPSSHASKHTIFCDNKCANLTGVKDKKFQLRISQARRQHPYPALRTAVRWLWVTNIFGNLNITSCQVSRGILLHSINSNNGLALNKRQSIIWTNDGLVYWRICASLSLNELTNLCQNIPERRLHALMSIGCPGQRQSLSTEKKLFKINTLRMNANCHTSVCPCSYFQVSTNSNHTLYPSFSDTMAQLIEVSTSRNHVSLVSMIRGAFQKDLWALISKSS